MKRHDVHRPRGGGERERRRRVVKRGDGYAIRADGLYFSAAGDEFLNPNWSELINSVWTDPTDGGGSPITGSTGLGRRSMVPRCGRLGGAHWGQSDRSRQTGQQNHLITDAQGVPLAAGVTGAHRHDVTQLLPLVDRIPAVAGRVGRPRRRSDQVQGERVYDSQAHRRALRKRGISALLARR